MTTARLRHIAAGIAALFVASFAGCQDAADPRQTLLTSWTEGLIVPGYRALADATEALDAAAGEACSDALRPDADPPTAEELDRARAAWRDARRRLKAMDVFAFGPYEAYPDRLGVHLDFWPVRADRIAERLADPPTAETIDAIGAAERGLPTAEYLLFAADVPWPGARCQYLLAATADIEANARALANAWDPDGGDYAATLLAPDGGRFDDAAGAFAMLINRLGDQVLVIRADRLGRPLGDKAGGVPQPDLVESPGSGEAIADIHATLSTIWLIYEGTGSYVGLKTHDRIEDRPDLDARFRQTFARATRALDAIEQPLARAVVDDPTTVQAAIDALGALQAVLQVDVQSALAVSLAFGSSDGD